MANANWLSSVSKLVPALRGRPVRDKTEVSADETSSGQDTMNPLLVDVLPARFEEQRQKYEERNTPLFLADERIEERQNVRLAKTILAFFGGTNTLRGKTLDQMVHHVREFREVFLESPIIRNNYGVNFSSGLSLFLIARCLAPSTIVESGVYKGCSSYVLAMACPQARKFAFDPNLRELSHRMRTVSYHEHDWMQSEIRCDPTGSGLCFFDDHQNQALRLIQAHERGFRHLVFDDSWPIEAVTGCGWPPLPSIDMVMGEPLALGQIVSWVENGKLWTYTHTAEKRELCEHARELIKAAYDVPTLYRECGIAPTSAAKFVELR